MNDNIIIRGIGGVRGKTVKTVLVTLGNVISGITVVGEDIR